MKAIILEKYGKDPVKYVDWVKPRYAANEVLVEIHAASINPIDNKIKQGKLKLLLPYKMPLVMGNDFSGVVVGVGKKVKHFKLGDEVYGRPRKTKIGTFAEYISIHEDELALKPKNLSFEEAASIPLVGLTSYQALNDILKMKPGDKVLIQAGAGGIGTFAIQLAKSMGLYVATTTSEAGVELVKRLGVDKVINYKKEDFSEILNNYDGVFDTLGNQSVIKAFPVVKRGGRIVSITAHPNKRFYKTYKKIYNLKLKHKLIFALTGLKFDKLERKYGVRYDQLFMFPSRVQLEKITELIESQKIKPVIDKIYPLEQAQSALNYSEQGHAKGKIILKIK